jgi:hypothetical protein
LLELLPELEEGVAVCVDGLVGGVVVLEEVLDLV